VARILFLFYEISLRSVRFIQSPVINEELPGLTIETLVTALFYDV